MSFSGRLRVIADDVYGSQVELAEKLGLTNIAVNNYISGKRKPSFEVISNLYNLGFSIDWLISGKGSMYRIFFSNNESDIYDDSILEELHKEIYFKHFGTSIKEEAYLIGNKKGSLYTPQDKSKALQRFLYVIFSVSALRNKILFTKQYNTLFKIVENSDFKIHLQYLIKRSKVVIEILTNPEYSKGKGITSLRIRNGISLEKLGIESKNQLFDLLTEFIFLIKEVNDYESFLKDAQEIDIKDKHRKKTLDSIYKISFDNLKSYYMSQYQLFENNDLIKNKSQILKIAVMNNFKFVE
ncbi:MAG: helix-turn-helix domain-containing protein [Chlorobiota bacterium]